MKHIKTFENYECAYFSDAMRLDTVESLLNIVKSGNEEDYEDFLDEPDFNMLLDPYDGYDKQTYVQYIPKTKKIIYWEGWSKLCWNALYQKKGYKGLSKEKAADKMVKERLIPSFESIGLKFISDEFFWCESDYDEVKDGYISKITFKL